MIRWTGLAPWDFEFFFLGSLTSTFLSPVMLPRTRWPIILELETTVYISLGGWELIFRERLKITHIMSPQLWEFQPEPRIRCRVLVLRGTQWGSSFRVQGSGLPLWDDLIERVTAEQGVPSSPHACPLSVALAEKS